MRQKCASAVSLAATSSARAGAGFLCFASVLYDPSGCSFELASIEARRAHQDAAPSGSISIYIEELRDSVPLRHRCSNRLGEHLQ